LLEIMVGDSDRARLAAQRALLSLPHWLIFIVLWLNFAKSPTDPGMRVNKILQEVYQRNLDNDPDTVKKYLNDMIKWGFLLRGGHSKFAMDADPFIRFQKVFVQGAICIMRAARLLTEQQPNDIMVLRARPS
jgi:hypothetical protein